MSRTNVQTLLKQALGVSMEDASEGAAVVINVNVDKENEAVAPIEEEVVVDEASSEAEESTEVVEELETAAATLESIALSLEAHIQEGGIDPMAATYLNHALAGVYERVGLRNTTPALESFGGGSSDRLAATQVSLEEVKEAAKKVWAAIKNAVAKAIQAMLDFFAKVFGGFEKIAARAIALKKTVEGLAGAKAEGKVMMPVASRLSLGGKFDGANVAKVVDNLSKAYGGLYRTFGAKLAEAIGDAAEGKEPKLAGLTTDLNMQEIGGGYEIESIKTGSYELPVLASKGVKLADEKQEFEPLSMTEMKDTLAKLQVICGEMTSGKKDIQAMADAAKKAVAKIGEDAKVRPADFSRIANGGMKVFNQFNAFAFKTARAALTAVERSAAAYKKEAPKAA